MEAVHGQRLDWDADSVLARQLFPKSSKHRLAGAGRPAKEDNEPPSTLSPLFRPVVQKGQVYDLQFGRINPDARRMFVQIQLEDRHRFIYRIELLLGDVPRVEGTRSFPQGLVFVERHGQAISPSAGYHGSRRKSRNWLLHPSAQPLRTLEGRRPTFVERRLLPAGECATAAHPRYGCAVQDGLVESPARSCSNHLAAGKCRGRLPAKLNAESPGRFSR